MTDTLSIMTDRLYLDQIPQNADLGLHCLQILEASTGSKMELLNVEDMLLKCPNI